MNKNEQYIKKEILRLTTSPSGECWARNDINKLADNAFKFMENGKEIDDAIYYTLAECDE